MNDFGEGSRKLKAQLNSIRESIVRFEKELNAGAERKQRANDQKLEALQVQLEQLNSTIDHEVARVEDELTDTETTAITTLDLIYKNLIQKFSLSIDGSAQPFRTFEMICDKLWSRLSALEDAKVNNSVLHDMAVLRQSIEELRQFASELEADHSKVERDVLQRIVHLQNMADQQFSYWSMLMCEKIQETRSLICGTQGDLSDEELVSSSAAPDRFLHECRGYAATGVVLPDKTFKKFIELEFEDIARDLAATTDARIQADNDIIEAVQRYTQSLQKSLQATELLKEFAESISQEG